MKEIEIVNKCIDVQIEYSDIPVQDRIYIAFGRTVTENAYDINDIITIINTIKSEFEFLEGVWNGEKRKS